LFDYHACDGVFLRSGHLIWKLMGVEGVYRKM